MNSLSSLRAALCMTLIATGASAQTTPSATYDVRFDATWSNTTHPGAYPAFAHFSPLIGATHDASAKLWESGGISSSGMEQMAETGGTSMLTSEINSLIGIGSAGSVVNGGAANSPGMASASFTATTTHSLFSLVTMIAPSPDWFVGIDSVQLLQGGVWVDSMQIDLYAWDAGTDNGANFNSGNSNTNPQDPIQLMTSGPFFGATPLGTFTLTLTSAATYCDGKVNSQGCLPTISTTGTASASGGASFDIGATNIINNKNGLMFYGFAANDAPFQGGKLCVGGQLTRATVQNSGGNAGAADCSGTFQFDMNALIQSGTDLQLVAGETVFAQYWYRDPQSPSGSGLTNGVEFVIAP